MSIHSRPCIPSRYCLNEYMAQYFHFFIYCVSVQKVLFVVTFTINPLFKIRVVHLVSQGVTGHELCHYFWGPDYRMEWESKYLCFLLTIQAFYPPSKGLLCFLCLCVCPRQILAPKLVLLFLLWLL